MTLSIDAKDTLKRTPMFRSGNFIDPWEPDPKLIDIRDIAYGLSRIARFCGQTPGEPLSVAQHSIYVSRLVPRNKRRAALLHDGPEYLTNDLPHHVKHGPGFLGMHFRELERRIARAVEEAFALWPGDLDAKVIKEADNRVFNMEWEDLVGREGVHPGAIRPWPWQRAEAEFLRVYQCYTEGR